MEEIQEIIKRIRLNYGERTSQNSLDEVKKTYDCEICKDTGFIHDITTNTSSFCSCRESRHYKMIYEKSGIAKAFTEKCFSNFLTDGKSDSITHAKLKAMDYVKSFPLIRNDRNNSIAFLGQVGSGKTHLCIAIANNLMKKCIGVLYFQYRDALTSLKQTITDDESYSREIYKYKNASVLLIDDLYKGMLKHGEPNDSDLRIVFEIINHRYLNNLPIIVSSEYTSDRLLDFDEAIGSRIIEMCQDNIIEFDGAELNYRLAK